MINHRVWSWFQIQLLNMLLYQKSMISINLNCKNGIFNERNSHYKPHKTHTRTHTYIYIYIYWILILPKWVGEFEFWVSC